MPRPPPPPAALTITGYPIPAAIARIASGSDGSSVSGPGTQGTPASIMALLAAILSPIVAMALASGPMKVSPAFSTAAEKLVFSERNP
ncbi:hypothetical protein D3C71_928020 [compost metagenome]